MKICTALLLVVTLATSGCVAHTGGHRPPAYGHGQLYQQPYSGWNQHPYRGGNKGHWEHGGRQYWHRNFNPELDGGKVIPIPLAPIETLDTSELQS